MMKKNHKTHYSRGKTCLNKHKAQTIEKSTSGITLIALVITIIVLLILAGVTIATLTGDNRNTISSAEC